MCGAAGGGAGVQDARKRKVKNFRLCVNAFAQRLFVGEAASGGSAVPL